MKQTTIFLFIACLVFCVSCEKGQAKKKSCDSLTRTECMNSVDCTLEKATTDKSSRLYRCRPAKAPCETGFRQADFHNFDKSIKEQEKLQEECDARMKPVICAFQPASCYCACRGNGHTKVKDGAEAEECVCDCGGGSPATCKEWAGPR